MHPIKRILLKYVIGDFMEEKVKENKIIGVFTEPEEVIEGSVFKLKIKAIRYLTCLEASTKKCEEMKSYTCGEVNGQ